MKGWYGDLLLATEHLFVQIPAISLSQQVENFFWFMSFLLHDESFRLFKTSHSFGPDFQAAATWADSALDEPNIILDKQCTKIWSCILLLSSI